jgi:hypothetical protein
MHYTWTAEVDHKEAWPFYRTISGVRLCWELEELKGPKGCIVRVDTPGAVLVIPEQVFPQGKARVCSTEVQEYRGTSLIRNRDPLGPYSRNMPKVLGGS